MKYISMQKALLYCWLTCTLLLPNLLDAQGKAAAFAWGGKITSNVAIEGFFADDFTISIRFMQQFPGAYRGPFLSVDHPQPINTFHFGQEIFSKADVACSVDRKTGKAKRTGETALYVQLGIQKWHYLQPVLRTPGRWHHFAFVKTGNQFRVYLDGVRLVEDKAKAETIRPNFRPRGNIHFGRNHTDKAQFYGLLDEFNVFDFPLSESDLLQIARRGDPGIPSTDILFEEYFNANTPVGWTLTSGCQLVPSRGDNVQDASRFLPPSHRSKYYVPFPEGEIWVVLQGMDNYQGGRDGKCGSHYGLWSFSVDMRRVGPGFSKQSQSEGEAIIASSSGKVAMVVDEWNNDNAGDPSNFVKVRSAPGEYISYMHFAKASNVLQEGERVMPHDYIARVSDIGAPGAMHLHQSCTSAKLKADAVSMPFAWNNYEYSIDKGRTWKYAERRRPLQGDWVRNAVSRLRVSGKLAMLRVNEVGVNYGSGEDLIGGEVIVQLEREPARRAYGFKLRTDVNEISHQGMLDQLRAAYRQNRTVILTFQKSGEASFKQKLVNVELE